MDNTIFPNRIYNTQEAAKAIGTSEAFLISEAKAGKIQSKQIGKGFKFLGEHILIYMGASNPVASGIYPNIVNAGLKPIKNI